jgi:hypothetical protein
MGEQEPLVPDALRLELHGIDSAEEEGVDALVTWTSHGVPVAKPDKFDGFTAEAATCLRYDSETGAWSESAVELKVPNMHVGDGGLKTVQRGWLHRGRGTAAQKEWESIVLKSFFPNIVKEIGGKDKIVEQFKKVRPTSPV